jgi:hypothetical protein
VHSQRFSDRHQVECRIYSIATAIEASTTFHSIQSFTTELLQFGGRLVNMIRSSLSRATFVLFSLQAATHGQTTSDLPTSVVTVDINGTPTTFRDVFTIPASADVGQNLLPNIQDPDAVNAQDVCPGYSASQLQEKNNGLTALLTLAGKPCDVYGNDVEVLNLKVEYQSENRLAVQITPANVVRQSSVHSSIQSTRLTLIGFDQLVVVRSPGRCDSTSGIGIDEWRW